jgi:uncharacterized protein YbjT (DUF2867 family)
MKILVIGGTGNVGGEVVKELQNAMQTFACLYVRKAMDRRRGLRLPSAICLIPSPCRSITWSG